MNKPGAFLLVSVLAAFGLVGLVATAEEPTPTGTISVAGQTYTFEIEVCNRFSQGELDSFALGGTVKTSDGSMGMIQVNTSKKAKSTEHAVTFIKMPTHYVAYVKKVDDEGWKNAQGEPAGPLVTVDGKQVSASGNFYTASYPPESVGVGTLTAICNQLVVTKIQ